MIILYSGRQVGVLGGPTRLGGLTRDEGWRLHLHAQVRARTPCQFQSDLPIVAHYKDAPVTRATIAEQALTNSIRGDRYTVLKVASGVEGQATLP